MFFLTKQARQQEASLCCFYSILQPFYLLSHRQFPQRFRRSNFLAERIELGYISKIWVRLETQPMI